MMALIPLAVFVAIAVFFVVWQKRTNRNIVSQFEKLGKRYGLVVDLSRRVGRTRHPSASGTYQGRRMDVVSYCIRRAGTYVRIACENRKGVDLLVTGDPLLSRVDLYIPQFVANQRSSVTPEVKLLDPGLKGLRLYAQDGAAAISVVMAGMKRELELAREKKIPVTIMLKENFLYFVDDLLLHSDRKRERLEYMVDALLRIAAYLER